MGNLKLKLKKVDAVKYGVISGATMALLVLIMLCIVLLFTSLAGIGAADATGLGIIFGSGIFAIILAPIIYFIFGFIFGWIGAMLLNFILKKTDGLNLEFEKSDLDIHKIGNE